MVPFVMRASVRPFYIRIPIPRWTGIQNPSLLFPHFPGYDMFRLDILIFKIFRYCVRYFDIIFMHSKNVNHQFVYLPRYS